MADETPNIGSEPPANARRDAIHVAVMPCVARFALYQGDRVEVAWDSNTREWAGWETDGDGWHGIVDPFLPEGTILNDGDRFWLFLKPNSITSLRHVWTHPTIKAGGPGEGA